MSQTQVARCLSCRAEVPVPASYAEGAQVSCGQCNTQLRIVRKGGLSLVIADPLALQDMLRQTRMDLAQTTRDLQRARASWGIGVNGLGLGLLYVVAKVALEERPLNQALFMEAAGLTVVVAVLLEVANHLFLAKRKAMSQLSEQLKRLEAEQRELQRKIRASTRP